MSSKDNWNRLTYGRCAKFSPNERKFIRSMANKYSHIVENKNSSNAEKNRTWEKITELFNAEPNHTKRHLKHIKKCYENLKARDKALGLSNNNRRPDQDLPDVINESSNSLHLGYLPRNLFQYNNSQYTQSSPHLSLSNDEDDDGVFNYVDVVVTEDEGQDLTEGYLNNTSNQSKYCTEASNSTLSSNEAQRIANQIQYDREKHILEMEDLKYKAEMSKIKLLQAKEELSFQREKWTLEREILFIDKTHSTNTSQHVINDPKVISEEENIMRKLTKIENFEYKEKLQSD